MTCASVDYWGLVLSKIPALKSISLIPIHGDKKQHQAVSFCALMSLHVDLTFSGIDYVVQYDPPQDPRMFNHRVGRTARLGKEGRSIVFLLPEEEDYVEFLRRKGVSFQEKKCYQEASDVIPTEAVLDKGVEALVSFVCAYKLHHCSYIFRWKSLEIGKLAMGYGLLRFPSVSEVKQGRLSSFGLCPSLVLRDKSLEKQRKQKLQAEKEKPREEKRERGKKNSKKAVAASPATRDSNKRKLTGKQRQTIQTAEDEEEMARDYRLLKKLKKGSVEEDDFAKLTGADNF
ncbi:hypothetical protein F2Q70_00006596 [Brassica cretica]|uniref:ATP-dependent RNA helicase n=1 Tax=Brassica cretica TaxID=69181 RepID=A0A8S9IPG1_BRACR|nr:hypothetical protein F2Q70_00006596 [Brassica cretica]